MIFYTDILILAGYSLNWHNERGSKQSKFWIWVGVEISDHPNATDGSKHEIHASMSVSDTVVTSKF